MITDPSWHPRLAAVLAGPSRWHTLRWVAEVGSTNDDVRAAAAAGERPGLVLVADRQRAGRGRAARRWEDPPPGGRSVAVSCLVDVPPDAAVSLTPAAAGLAVVEALSSRGVDAVLKWPNDVLAPGDGGPSKLCGVLVERHDLEAGSVLVIGIGIDVDWRSVDRAGGSSAWTSVAEAAGVDIETPALVADVLVALDARLRELVVRSAALRDDYRDRCATIGRQVHVEQPGGRTLRGHAVDIAADGALLVDVDGHRVEVTVGDVHHLRVS